MAYNKHDEKEMQKHEEKGRSDALGGVIGATVLIWAGVVLLAGNLGYLYVFTGILDSLGISPYSWEWEMPFFDPRAWQVFFLGAGVIVLFEIVIRLLVPLYRRRVMGTFIGAIVLFALGLGQWTVIWPLILIAIGLSILLRGLFRRG
jgi:hypothetical protein